MRKKLTLLLAALALLLATVPGGISLAQDNNRRHTVQPGENLFRIALRYGVSVQAVAQANNISNPSIIFVGQVLVIPGPGGTPPATPVPPGPTPVPPTAAPPATPIVNYTVQRGDSLSIIARRFNTTVQAIIRANGIVNPNRILAGQVLRIPSATGEVPLPATPIPGNPNPSPIGAQGFEVGGHAIALSGNTESVLRSARMTWVKFQVQNGDPNANNLIQGAKNAGFKVLLSVVGDKNRVLDGGFQDEYANYVAGLARAGADGIQVWNEMNIDREWPTGQINPAAYVQLLSKAYRAIKAANPNVLVMTGAPAPTGAEGAFGLARVWNDDRYYAGMAAAGAGNFADCIGVHYNEGIVPPSVTRNDPRGDNYPTRYFTTMLNRALASFPGKRACYSELGYLSPEGYPALPEGFGWAASTTAQQQAQWLGEAVALARASGRVRLLIVFNIDFTRYDSDPQAGFAIIRPGNVCIACATIAAALP
jgi:LysM repeat protein